MRATAVVLPWLGCIASLLACERDPHPAAERAPTAVAHASATPTSPRAPGEPPALSREVAPPSPPLERATPSPPPTTPAPARPGMSVRSSAARTVRDLPEAPPSIEPAAYAAWLHALPAAGQRAVTAFCRAHPVDFERRCGGIGPLHIPYPPHPRVRAPRPGDLESRFGSLDTWHASLTRAQRAYVRRECPGGEDAMSSDLCGDNTPLVVAFDNQPVAYTAGGQFAFQADTATATDWPTAATPWIALDRNGDGAIDHGAELFGSDTVLPDGTTAANGFVALATLDANHDGRIDAHDPGFADLVLWADRNHDQRSSPDELQPLARVIVSLALTSRVEPRCDARGNCERERAGVVWLDLAGATHTGSVVDVYLPRR